MYKRQVIGCASKRPGPIIKAALSYSFADDFERRGNSMSELQNSLKSRSNAIKRADLHFEVDISEVRTERAVTLISSI